MIPDIFNRELGVEFDGEVVLRNFMLVRGVPFDSWSISTVTLNTLSIHYIMALPNAYLENRVWSKKRESMLCDFGAVYRVTSTICLTDLLNTLQPNNSTTLNHDPIVLPTRPLLTTHSAQQTSSALKSAI